jgi:hypothetical protein
VTEELHHASEDVSLELHRAVAERLVEEPASSILLDRLARTPVDPGSRERIAREIEADSAS